MAAEFTADARNRRPDSYSGGAHRRKLSVAAQEKSQEYRKPVETDLDFCDNASNHRL
jgi:hypothetical protein